MREGRIGERASIERLLKRESAKLSQGKVRIFAAAACFFDDDEDLLFLFPAPLLRRLFLPPFLSLTHTPPRFQNALSIKNANKKQQPQSTTASRAASLPTPKAERASGGGGGGGAAAAAGKRTPVASFKLENSASAAAFAAALGAATTPGGAVKACQQCGATKTPQWREGPEGSFSVPFLVSLFFSLQQEKKKRLTSSFFSFETKSKTLPFRPQDPLQRLRRQARPGHPCRRQRRRRGSGSGARQEGRGEGRRRPFWGGRGDSERRQAQRRRRRSPALVGLRDGLRGLGSALLQPLRPRRARGGGRLARARPRERRRRWRRRAAAAAEARRRQH